VAFTKACAELFELSSNQVHAILETIKDETVKKAKQALFVGEGCPFQHPYVSTAYQFVALL